MSPTLVLAATGPAASIPKGPAINIFSFGGGRYRSYRQHARGPAINVSNFKLRWWPLPDMPVAPSRGPAIDISSFGGGHDWPCQQHPKRGPPSTSSASVVAAIGPAASTPQGALHRHL
jgi:hypothetical protein